MSNRGIGVEGVASEIGALARVHFQVREDELIEGLCQRFEATSVEAQRAIQQALEVAVILRVHIGKITLIILRQD